MTLIYSIKISSGIILKISFHFQDDDSMDKDGNELDGECSRPQKHAKSPELAREFLLDAATVIFKEQACLIFSIIFIYFKITIHFFKKINYTSSKRLL